MGPASLSLVAAVVAAVAGVSVTSWWVAGRRTAAADMLRTAEEQSAQARQQATREAETIRKEAALEARERAHGVLTEAEEQARRRRDEIGRLEQALGDKTRSLTERIIAADSLEKDLRTREARVAQLRTDTETALQRTERLLQDRQRELQRVAGLTADEARDLLLKQIESEARREAANLVKRIEAEARETAGQRAQH